jgi:Uma2 family endonuclease
MATAMVTTHRFTADEYQRMGEAGILLEDDRVELIEGEIVDMTPLGNKHKSAVNRLCELFVQRCSDRAIVQVQSSVRLNDYSEPEPDIVLLRRRDDFYARTTAGPADTFLVVEVADSSLALDKDVKAPLYARNGIPEYWLVDLEAETIIVFREPGTEGYASMVTLRGNEAVSPLAFPDAVIRPADVIL